MKGQRILILGGKDFSGVDCQDWVDLRLPDIADYHVVIVNVVSMTKNLRERFFQGEIKFHLLELLNTGGTLFAIGCPRKLITPFHESNYAWCPIPLEITNLSGANFYFEDSTFKDYFRNVRQFLYYFDKPNNLKDGNYSYEYSIQHSVKNRHGKYLAGKIVFNRYRTKEVPRSSTGYDGTKEVLSEKNESGDFYFLPSPTEITDIEAISYILNKFLNIHQITPPPEWTESFGVPELNSVQEQMKTNIEKITQITQENDSLRKKEAELVSYRELLYETGIALEEIVRKIFTILGHEPKPPKFKEEFIIEFDNKVGIIECKGNEKSIKRDDFRQILEHTKEYELEGRVDYKGILIGNGWRLLPVQDRNTSDTPIFPKGKDGVIEIAAKHGIALVSSVDLFNVFCKFLKKEVSAEDILRRIFSANGEASFNF